MQYHIHPSYKHPKLMLIKVTWKNAISWNIYCKHAVSGETSVQVKDKLILNWFYFFIFSIILFLGMRHIKKNIPYYIAEVLKKLK